MDVSEYRRQYEAELEEASRKAESPGEVLRKAQQGGGGQRAFAAGMPAAGDELSGAVAALDDLGAKTAAFSAALEIIGLNVGRHPDLIDTLCDFVADANNPVAKRLAVLNLLQEIAFTMASMPAKRPKFIGTLRSIMEDPDADLRRRAIGILAREKDDYVQRRLIDGLEGRAKALVPAAKAIQFLGYDVHADHFPVVRRIAENPPNQGAQIEAIRVLAADPSAKDLLLEILKDKDQKPDVKRASAISLQALAPDQFAEQARRIVLDSDEDDQLRALSLNALTFFADPAAFTDDAELTRGVEQLSAESASRHLKKAAAGYMARHSS